MLLFILALLIFFITLAEHRFTVTMAVKQPQREGVSLSFPKSVVSCRHEGPVWQVAWAHPMYGNILASCSYDRKVIIWKEENGTWEKTYEYTGHDSSGMWDLELGRETGGVRGFRKVGINLSALRKKASSKQTGIN